MVTGFEENNLGGSVGSALDVGGKAPLVFDSMLARLLKCYPAVFAWGVLILERLEGLVGVLDLAQVARKAEIAQLERALRVEEYVGGLNVSVDDTRGVQIPDANQQLVDNILYRILVQLNFVAREQVRQIETHRRHDEVERGEVSTGAARHQQHVIQRNKVGHLAHLDHRVKLAEVATRDAHVVKNVIDALHGDLLVGLPVNRLEDHARDSLSAKLDEGVVGRDVGRNFVLELLDVEPGPLGVIFIICCLLLHHNASFFNN